MGIVDELMTPGCPQCAIKHLSAALYHRAKLAGADARPDPYMVEVCTAYINLVEVRAGYRSHLWYAVGALVRAEEWMAPRMASECVAREVRLMLEEHGVEALIDALSALVVKTDPGHADWAYAHFYEARRELPAYVDDIHLCDLVGAIEKIRKDFFITDQEVATATSAEGVEKGGEEAMATKKPAKAMGTVKAACKGGKCKDAPKAAKAACKGGKCKDTKAACKGGKCKK